MKLKLGINFFIFLGFIICFNLLKEYYLDEVKIMIEDYIPRLFDETLKFALKSKGAVLVVGPKWCG